MIRLSSWRHRHCSALSVSRINQIAWEKNWERSRLLFSSNYILSNYFVEIPFWDMFHVCDMGEKNTSNLQKHQEF